MKGFDMGGMLRQAQKMQKEMARVQEELKKRVVEGSAGGGMVTAQVTGGMELVALKIDPQVLTPSDKDVLEEMIVAAVNAATQEAQKMLQQEMGKLTGGMGLPPGLV